MPRTAPFEKYHDRYEQWFEEHRTAYVSELLALRPFVPWEGRGLEIGVGTARFAAPLGVQCGIDPSRRKRDPARALCDSRSGWRASTTSGPTSRTVCANAG